MRFINLFSRGRLVFILIPNLLLVACLPVKVPPQNYVNIQNAIKKAKFHPSVRSTFRPYGERNINIKGKVEFAITLKGSDTIFEGYDLGWCGSKKFKQPAISNQYSESIQKIDCTPGKEKRRISQNINLRLAQLVRNIKLLGENALVKSSNDIYIWLYLPIIEFDQKHIVDFEDPNQVITTPLNDTDSELIISKADIQAIGKIKDDRIPQSIIMVPKTFHDLAGMDWAKVSDEKIISGFKSVGIIKKGNRQEYTQAMDLPKDYLENIFLMTVK